MTRAVFFAGFGLLAALTACGASEGGGTPSGTPSGGTSSGGTGTAGNTGAQPSSAGKASEGDGTSLADYPQAYAEALCQVLVRCWQSFAQEGGESCENIFDQQLSGGVFGHLVEAVNDGRVEYRPLAASACFEATEATSCADGLVSTPEICGEVFVGSLEAGSPCTLDAECAGNSQCLVDGSCPGMCGPRAQEGERCTAQNSCNSGLICMVDSSGGGICTAPVHQVGGSCSATIPCTTFLACSGLNRSDPNDTGTCNDRDALFSGALGAACSLVGEDALCELGLVCALRGESGQVLGTCEEPVASGAACPVALPDACPNGEYCRITTAAGVMPPMGRCLPNPALGEECRYSNSLSAPCGVDQFCSSSTNLCAQSKNLGDSCTTDEECFSDTCGMDAKCAALLECERG